jgi:4,5-dihydroxyphthalate decarboxylase
MTRTAAQQGPDELVCAVMPRPRTAALVDGRVSVDGVRFTDSLPSRERHALLERGGLAAGEMSTSGLVRMHAAGSPLTALPVFLKRGFSHRHVITRQEAPFTSPLDLAGRRIGVDSWTSSIIVWLRGLFHDAYDLEQSAFTWVLAGEQVQAPAGTDIQQMPDRTVPHSPEWVGRELIDGAQRPLRSTEKQMLGLLRAGDVDAVLSATVPSGPGLRCLFEADAEQVHADWHRRSGVYPINHTLAVQSAVLDRRPKLADELVQAFRSARSLAGDPSPALTADLAVIGHDPFRYAYGPQERHVLDTFIGYQVASGLIDVPFPADELFTADVLAL